MKTVNCKQSLAVLLFAANALHCAAAPTTPTTPSVTAAQLSRDLVVSKGNELFLVRMNESAVLAGKSIKEMFADPNFQATWIQVGSLPLNAMAADGSNAPTLNAEELVNAKTVVDKLVAAFSVDKVFPGLRSSLTSSALINRSIAGYSLLFLGLAAAAGAGIGGSYLYFVQYGSQKSEAETNSAASQSATAPGATAGTTDEGSSQA